MPKAWCLLEVDGGHGRGRVVWVEGEEVEKSLREVFGSFPLFFFFV